jgi:hypothetical protein
MSQYDPYTYGQVNLGGKPPRTSPTSPSADDLLFAAPDVPAKAASVDTSWDALDDDLGSLLPNASSIQPNGRIEEFGADILGESVETAMPHARPRVASPGLKSGNARQPLPYTTRNPAVGQQPLVARTITPGSNGGLVDGAMSGAKFRPPTNRPALRRRSGVRRVLAVTVPAALLAGGGTGATWLCTVQQNLVLGGIGCALTLVAVAFSWIWLRG